MANAPYALASSRPVVHPGRAAFEAGLHLAVHGDAAAPVDEVGLMLVDTEDDGLTQRAGRG